MKMKQLLFGKSCSLFFLLGCIISNSLSLFNPVAGGVMLLMTILVQSVVDVNRFNE